ncbi:MAG: GspE/PulE family protein [Candidatus Komeilibacteria bacterium]|nr:GspE/PulE family protein [Candidatus Komeilibacteria bacterium]
MPETNRQILEALRSSGQLNQAKYQQYQALADQDQGAFFAAVEADSDISSEALAQAKGRAWEIPYVNLEGKNIPLGILKILPQDLSANYQMLVFSQEGSVLNIGMVDPHNYKAVEAIEFLARKKNYRLRYFIISPDSFKLAYKNYESLREQVSQALDFAEEKFGPKAGEGEAATVLEEVVKTAPVSKIVSVILRHAIEGGASDIHIEPVGDKSRVRYRIDGILHTSIVLPIYVHAALVSRIKVLSNLKIDETRIPQDGRLRITTGGQDYDFRISTIPLVNQEKVEMRILESPEKAPSFEQLGFLGNQLKLMELNLTRPNGMFLVTGPTGSGKSTTLFAALFKLNQEGVNISTLEDPVEYYIKGVNQSQVKTEVGFTFATGLRALLRQDPNVIMVGEIRDGETSQLVIQAALTGHFVLSTLHTNDAAGAIPRLIDMGAEPFLLASTLNLIVAQRLVRKICPNCKAKSELPPEIREEIHTSLANLPPEVWYEGVKANQDLTVYKGSGCAQCGQTGYKGRLCISETLTVAEKMRDIIARGSPAEELKRELAVQKFININQDGWMKALLGMTTVEEILRVTKTEE